MQSAFLLSRGINVVHTEMTQDRLHFWETEESLEACDVWNFKIYTHNQKSLSLLVKVKYVIKNIHT